jgi:membrane-associated phospholipid phosphatase
MPIPNKDSCFLYIKLSILLNLLFIFVYGGTNWINSQRTDHWTLYSHSELSIPLIPEFIFLYLSFSLLTIAPLFILQNSQIILLAKRMALGIIVSGVIFLLIPTQLGFSRTIETIDYNLWFSLLYQVDYPYNLFPSLHIVLSTITFLGLLPFCSKTLSLIFSLWWLLLCSSVIFVHQHHIADIAGGLLIALLVIFAVKDREKQY